MIRPDLPEVSLLILGAGWTSKFLLPLLNSQDISHAATTTTGHDNTIAWTFDPDNTTDPTSYKQLPRARTVLITFPLKGPGQSTTLTSLYRKVHGADNQWIQLGSTGIFNAPHWNDHRSSYDKTNARAIAEDELMAPPINGCTLNLAGLYDYEGRNPRGWIRRVVKTRDDARGKKALHLVHGADVARAIVAVHGSFTPGERWIITDLRVYDWWDLLMSWCAEGPVRKEEEDKKEPTDAEIQKWVGEAMFEGGVRALPRGPETLGRVVDSTAFWRRMGILPCMERLH